MRAAADPVIVSLDAAIRSPRVADYVDAALARAADALHQSDGPMAWETVPLDLFEQLPAEILSCWVFLLRASADTGAERHPNSHQRSLSLVGEGETQLRVAGQWRTHVIGSDPDSPLDSRWVTIPPGTWHRWVVGPRDWAVLSFHTVPADSLIEERPSAADDLDGGATERRTYQRPGFPGIPPVLE